MTYKQIEASREARLWIGQVIVPAVSAAVLIIGANPELKNTVKTKALNVKDSITNRFQKKKV